MWFILADEKILGYPVGGQKGRDFELCMMDSKSPPYRKFDGFIFNYICKYIQ